MLDVEQQLSLISKAWGDQRGWTFFPWIPGDWPLGEPRKNGWHEGPAFKWPRDREQILAHMRNHRKDDLFWSCNLFEEPTRSKHEVMDQKALWADLDEVDPHTIEDRLKPTVAWETSPGRYQALWILNELVMNVSWPGYENHRLTRYLDADRGGWDTTQVLRIPGWMNHKAEYRQETGGVVPGQLIWQNGPVYTLRDFEWLPEVGAVEVDEDIFGEDLENIDRATLWEEIRLKVPRTAREYMENRDIEVEDRSRTMFWLMRCFADIGMSTLQIVALIRPTVWNKFSDRANELVYLITEASKAVGQRSDETLKKLQEEEQEKPEPELLDELIENFEEPPFLIRGFLPKGACGFIAAQPKTFKSWMALDAAISVATQSPFLNHFAIERPGPVLYIQEEDPIGITGKRVKKIKASKELMTLRHTGAHTVEWVPLDKLSIKAILRKGMDLSDPSWQGWLADQLEKGFSPTQPYSLLILDPLMQMQGPVDENRAGEMTAKIFKPLKQLAERFGVSILVVHHMNKRQADGVRGGQLMLGSVANHAWAECSLYLTIESNQILVEMENKYTIGKKFRIQGIRSKAKWEPKVVDAEIGENGDFMKAADGQRPKRKPRQIANKALVTLQELDEGWHDTSEITQISGLSKTAVHNGLGRALKQGLVASKKVKGRILWSNKSQVS